MTLTKDYIITSVQNHMGLSKARSIELVENLLEIIKETLASGEDILISGFGKFCVKEKKERIGRNPHTGEDLMLGPRRIVNFKCSSPLKEKLNGSG